MAQSFAGLTVSVIGEVGALPLPPSTKPDDYPDSEGLQLPSVFMHYAAGATSNTLVLPRQFREVDLQRLRKHGGQRERRVE